MIKNFPPFKVDIKYFPKQWPKELLISMETPLKEHVCESFNIEIRGLISRHSGTTLGKPQQVDFVVDDNILWTTPIDLPRPDAISNQSADAGTAPIDATCGFNTVLPTFISIKDKPITMLVTLDSGNNGEPVQFKLGVITFTSLDTNIPAPSTELKVACVNSIGRSGSSLLCRLLNEHPDCVAPMLMGQFGEVSILGYYLRTIAVLSSEGALSELNKFDSNIDFLNLPAPFLKSDPLHYNLEKVLESNLQSITRERSVDLFYKVLNEVTQFTRKAKPGANCWVEKNWNTTSCNLGPIFVKGWREIILVRDMRSFWYSQVRYQNKIQTSPNQIIEHTKGTFDKYIALGRSYLDRKEQALLVRFEDLISNPGEELARVLEYLDLPLDPYYLTKIRNIVNSDDSVHNSIRSPQTGETNELDFDTYIASFDEENVSYLKSLLSEMGYVL